MKALQQLYALLRSALACTHSIRARTRPFAMIPGARHASYTVCLDCGAEIPTRPAAPMQALRPFILELPL